VVTTDTVASRYQARVYGGYIPEDSLFATYQSYGAIGFDATGYENEPWAWRGFLSVFRWICLVAAVIVFVGQGEEIDVLDWF
jgi:hypothetical protein